MSVFSEKIAWHITPEIHLALKEGTSNCSVWIGKNWIFKSKDIGGKVKHELRVPSYNFRYTSYEFKSRSEKEQQINKIGLNIALKIWNF